MTAEPFDQTACLAAHLRSVRSLDHGVARHPDRLEIALQGRRITLPLPACAATDRLPPAEWYGRTFDAGNLHEPGLVAWLLVLADQLGAQPVTFFDVGALYGIHSIFAAALFKDATCVAVEPHAQTAAWLRVATRDMRRISVRESLITAADGPVLGAFRNFVWDLHATSTAIEGVSLATLLADTVGVPIVKIDTEGMQAHFLPAATQDLIERKAVLLMECDRPEKLGDGCRTADLVAPFLGAGYSMSWCDHRMTTPALALTEFPEALERNGLVCLLPPSGLVTGDS